MNTKKQHRGLYWFRNDCRLTDMPALTSLTEQVESLLCVYVIDPDWFNENRWQCRGMGETRWQFVCEGLHNLNASLQARGHRLIVLEGKPIDILSELIEVHQITHLGVAKHSGPNEQQHVEKLQAQFHHVKLISPHANVLYSESDLPFALEDMPDVFSPFRHKVEKHAKPKKPLPTLDKLPPMLNSSHADWPKNVTRNLSNTNKIKQKVFFGGESAALKQLDYYLFATDHIAQYKATRNGMLGWDFSSKLSAWLAAGHISPGMVNAEVARYEVARTKNDSTYWMFFELLWREFFYWQLHKHGSKFFAFEGIQQKHPGTVMDLRRYEAWKYGETGYDIVDACMRELNVTGFMSNRGRQLVASCFVHELKLDWRYGAAYFEQQLIDYDVASNYGNWQYLAGVGSDPRGHRQFNLEKQTQQYDSSGAFRRAWLT